MDKEEKIELLLNAAKDTARLTKIDLSNHDFSNIDLYKAAANDNLLYFEDINFSGCNFSNSNLSKLNFIRCNFSNAVFNNVKLNHTYFSGTCYYKNTDFTGSELYTAMFNFDKSVLKNAIVPMACPESGSFIGYKIVLDKPIKKTEYTLFGKPIDVHPNLYILKLEIPEDAKRSSATGRKCRCDKAKVIGSTSFDYKMIGGRINTFYSMYDSDFIYRIGETVSVDNFDDNRWNECSTGIHFYTDFNYTIKKCISLYI